MEEKDTQDQKSNSEADIIYPSEGDVNKEEKGNEDTKKGNNAKTLIILLILVLGLFFAYLAFEEEIMEVLIPGPEISDHQEMVNQRKDLLDQLSSEQDEQVYSDEERTEMLENL